MKWKSWVGDGRRNVPEGKRRAQMKKWWHSYSTSAPWLWETEPRPQGWAKEKGGEALWILRVLQWLWRKQKICGDNTNVQLGQVLLLTYCGEGQHQNISEIFLNVNKEWMRWYYSSDSAKNPEIFITTFSDKEKLHLIQLILFQFNLFQFCNY